MEEILAHWSTSQIVARDHVPPWEIYVNRVPADRERSPWGFAECNLLLRGNFSGSLTLRRTGQETAIAGVIWKPDSDSETKIVVHREGSGSDDWPELLERAKELLGAFLRYPHAPFPPDWKVEVNPPARPG